MLYQINRNFIIESRSFFNNNDTVNDAYGFLIYRKILESSEAMFYTLKYCFLPDLIIPIIRLYDNLKCFQEKGIEWNKSEVNFFSEMYNILIEYVYYQKKLYAYITKKYEETFDIKRVFFKSPFDIYKYEFNENFI